MSKKIHTEAVDSLFEAILSLKNKEECYTFFEDVCTINELLSLSQRFEVAKMLRQKKTYLEISEKTGASGGCGQTKKPRQLIAAAAVFPQQKIPSVPMAP